MKVGVAVAISCLIAMLLSGCGNDSTEGRPVGPAPTLIHEEGRGLGWFDLRYRFPANMTGEMTVELTIDYGRPEAWPAGDLFVVGADIEGDVGESDFWEFVGVSRAPQSTGDTWIDMNVSGQHQEESAPVSVPRTAASDARTGLPEVFSMRHKVNRDSCGTVVHDDLVCHMFRVLAGGSPDARFQIWVNATAGEVALTHGSVGDTFWHSRRSFDAPTNVGVGVGDAQALAASDLQLAAPIGNESTKTILIFRATASVASQFTAPSEGDGWFAPPGGNRTRASGNVIQVGAASGTWTFGLDSSATYLADQPILWGAAIMPALLPEK